MDYLLLLASTLAVGGQGLFCKFYSDNAKASSKNTSYTYCTMMGITCAVIMFCIAGFKFTPSLPTILIGIEQAVIFFLYNFFLSRSLLCGASYSIVSISAPAGAMILPFLESTIIYHADLSVISIISIILILISLVLVNLDGLKTHTIKLKHLFYYAMLFVTNGIYSVMTDVHQKVMNGTERTDLMMIIYVLSAVFALASMIVKNKRFEPKEFGQTPKSILFLLICSVNATTQIYLIMYLLNKISAAVVYALCNGGCLAVASIYSFLLLKEKMSFPKILGIVIIIVGVVLLSIF